MNSRSQLVPFLKIRMLSYNSFCILRIYDSITVIWHQKEYNPHARPHICKLVG